MSNGISLVLAGTVAYMIGQTMLNPKIGPLSRVSIMVLSFSGLVVNDSCNAQFCHPMPYVCIWLIMIICYRNAIKKPLG